MELPKIPDSFLYVMGISSVGYLAGKVTRKTGPVIRSLVISNVGPAPPPVAPPAGAANPARTQLTINLIGENIAENATVKVDDKDLRITDQYTLTGTKRQDQAPEPAFCTELRLVLLDAEAYLEGSHTVTVTNRDGQMASATFPIDPMAIDLVTVNPQRTVITVTGKNFADGITAQWKTDVGATTDAQQVTWNKADPNKLVVTFQNALNLPGTLVLKSPVGLRASTKVAAQGA